MVLLSRDGGTPMLTIVIVSWNVRDYLVECLESLAAADVQSWAVIEVVDNASSDDTCDVVRRRFPFVALTASRENLGFSRANNLVLARCRTPYVLLLNPDTVVPPGALRAMVGAMEASPDIGALGPRQHGRHGQLQADAAANLPTVWNVFCELAMLSKLFPKSRVFARRSMGWWAHDDDRDVPGLAGSAMLLRTSALRATGLLDENMFCVEDMDICRRVHDAGFRVHYLGTVSITHYGGESVKRSKNEGLQRQIAYQSFWVYLRKHEGALVAASLAGTVAVTASIGVVAASLLSVVPGLPVALKEGLGRYRRLLAALLSWSVKNKLQFAHPLAAPVRPAAPAAKAHG